MTISRREFLRSSASAVAAGVAASSVLRGAAMQAGQSTARRKLVLLELGGGNDALNTVIPIGERRYFEVRPTLAIPAARALMLDGGIALHPAMWALRDLYRKNQLAVIQGVGYPNPSRSHFRSMEVWHRGDTAEQTATGWLARSCRHALAGDAELSMPMVHCGQQDPDVFQGFGTSSGKSIELPHGEEMIRLTHLDAVQAMPVMRELFATRRTPKSPYPQGRLGASLSLFAQMIVQNAPARFFHISQSGFDTHARQAETHAQLLGEVSTAVGAFLADLRAEGHDQDVLVMVFSEFGRRLRENSSAGTDHGAAGVLLFAGGSVKGGLYGRYPSLTDLDNGDLRHTVDFRDCYATVLESWLGIAADPVLGQPCRPVPFV